MHREREFTEEHWQLFGEGGKSMEIGSIGDWVGVGLGLLSLIVAVLTGWTAIHRRLARIPTRIWPIFRLLLAVVGIVLVTYFAYQIGAGSVPPIEKIVEVTRIVEAEVTTVVTPTPDASLSENLVMRFDFESSAAGWEDIEKWDENWNYIAFLEDAATLPSSQEERGLAYRLTVEPARWVHYTVDYAEPVKADLIVAHLFAQDSSDIQYAWFEINALDEKGNSLAEVGDDIAPGKWKQLVLDLRGQYGPNDSLLRDTSVFVRIVFALMGAADLESETIAVRLDDVALYRATGDLSIREQRGVGRTLFDFENWDQGGWQVSDTRVSTDTLDVVGYEEAYRGRGALRLDTVLSDGEKTWASSTWRGIPPQGGWIVQVYLPEDVPAETGLWANLYTYGRTGWLGSETSDLRKGAWNTLVWDTSNVDWGVEPQVTIGIQIGAEDGPYQGPIYFDDIQVFER